MGRRKLYGTYDQCFNACSQRITIMFSIVFDSTDAIASELIFAGRHIG